MFVADNLRDKGTTTQRLLKDKEGTILMLKKNIEIPATRIIQTGKLTEIKKEKETLNTELINCKARLLRKEEKEGNWKKYTDL